METFWNGYLLPAFGGAIAQYQLVRLKNYSQNLLVYKRTNLCCTSVGVIPQHRPRWRWRLVQLFIALHLACHLFVDVACCHTYPQSCSQSRVVQQDTHLEEIVPLYV